VLSDLLCVADIAVKKAKNIKSKVCFMDIFVEALEIMGAK